MENKIKITILMGLFIFGMFISFTLSEDAGGVYAVESKTILGSNNLGYVEKIGPFGNTKSRVKIAYIIGVHPLESKSHTAIYRTMINRGKSLNYCYYIYRVKVTKDAKSYSKGRVNGQYLARDYVVPDIKKQSYNLVVDVHSNRGNYGKRRFVFAPKNHAASKKVALRTAYRISWLSYHYPKSQTSPKYVTEPLVRSGIKTILYENYMYQTYSRTYSQAVSFVKVVDKLQF
ncbi:MAG: hypothetical protein U1C19_01670 [Methanobacteriaceae archaeon]|nr:hypothetical protein [Methanobacteriaceae archaeon]